MLLKAIKLDNNLTISVRINQIHVIIYVITI